MGIIIVILVYTLIAFFMYKLLESKKEKLVFVVNILGLLCFYFINNGTSHILLSLVVSIINGLLFSFIGLAIYNKYNDLNKFLGTSVLIEFLLSLMVNFVFGLIFKNL